MPIFCYKCPDCEWTLEDSRPRADRNLMPMCQACGAHCERDMNAEHGCSRMASSGEVRSVNAGVGIDQIQEANKHYADLDVHFCPKTGDMVARNRGQYLKALERRGLFNRDEVRSPKHFS